MSNIIQPTKKSIVHLGKIKKKAPVIGIVIQARMTSKRFPGKSMELLNGKPVLEWVITRCKYIRPADKIIVAVPDTPESDPMLELADRLGVDNFCGEEDDVLNRYYKAALFHKLDVIVRVTADCPFINPIIGSQVVQLLIWRKVDYASNIYPVRTFPMGTDCEAFTVDCLDAANQIATEEGDREHVTKWMQEEEGVRKANVTQAVDCSLDNWCVDYPEDIKRLEKLYKKMSKKNNIISIVKEEQPNEE